MKKSCEHYDECLKMIQRVLDREATNEEESTFLNKKDDCIQCQEGYELEQSLKMAIKNNGRSLCPDQLFQRIRAKLFLFLILITILIPLFC